MAHLNHYTSEKGLKLNRRRFTQWMLFSGLAIFSPKTVFSSLGGRPMPERSLFLYNPNTRESLDTVYWSHDYYLPQALSDINRFMRDYRTGEIKTMDTRLLDLLHTIQKELNPKKPIHIISAYRSRRTNANLRRRGKGAAANSYHMQAKAADIRLPGYRLSALRRTAWRQQKGGVGYYPKDSFIHIDVGPLRCWSC
jgi:uncharacterized protein YcbK (DUF882 family)